MLLLFTENNIASKNIADRLIESGFKNSGKDEWCKNGVKMINTHAKTVLDVPTDFETDCILVLSSHKSMKPKPMLTVHFPGNWGNADMGGKKETLNIAYASKLRQLFVALVEKNKTGLNWEVCVEADHHGPTCDVPIIFIEIGSSENEWKDELAGETVAQAIMNCLGSPEPAKTFLGVGGGHYAKEFSKLMLERNIAIGHILPKYGIDEAKEEVLMQAIEKNTERLDGIILLRESTNVKQRKKITDFAERNGITCEIV
jgi:D-aminoacyl-tRNA deacylase